MKSRPVRPEVTIQYKGVKGLLVACFAVCKCYFLFLKDVKVNVCIFEHKPVFTLSYKIRPRFKLERMSENADK